jgi:hypothetical protein
VCQLPGTTNRIYYLGFWNQWYPWAQEGVRGYDPLLFAEGFMGGSGVPLRDGVYADSFDSFSLGTRSLN